MTDPHKEAVERVTSDLLNDNADLPIQADLYRGPGNYEYLNTDACGTEWFVRVKPTSFDVCVSAAGRYEWGYNDVVGEVTVVHLPQASPGVVDVEAVQGSRFHVELLAAIREKVAVVKQMHANVTA
jgi:hypothetical protein